MFGGYKDPVKYIKATEEKDLFGNYKENEPVDKLVRYVGGIVTQVSKGNSFVDEHRLLYHCNFEVNVNDRFIIDSKEHIVKFTEKVVDIFSDIMYWRVELL